MGVPPVLPLPAAAGGQAGRPPRRPWGRMLLLGAALLLLAPAAGTPGLPKAALSLQPPWPQVFPEDNVTLSCQGARGPGDNATRWFLNGTAIPGLAQPRYSFRASSSRSGDYRCQTGRTSLSDPVHLDVTSAWLLLQTPRRRVPQGQPIVLRCHSWRNWRLHKITFFQDGKPKWFAHTNASFSIPHANASHSGAYHCSGFLGQTLHSSQPVSITVPGRLPPTCLGPGVRCSGAAVRTAHHCAGRWGLSSGSGGLEEPFLCVRLVPSKHSLLVVMVAVIASIVAVAGVAGVAWVCFRRHQSSGRPARRERGETRPEQPANMEGADVAAKAEVENAVTYSLLHHEAPEEDTGP